MSVLREQSADYRLGFREPAGEVAVAELPTVGALPEWLAGSLVRLTPARFEAGSTKLRHWFDGQAMLHAFAIEGGRVSYANRWLRTRQFQAIERDGRLKYSEFATDPCRSIFKGVGTTFDPKARWTDNGVVNLVKLGGEHLALTETPLPVRFDAETLETLGVTEWAQDIPGMLTTAHPHGDGGRLINYVADVGRVNRYRFYTLAPGGRPRTVAEMPVREPAYVHSFALTPSYLVLTEIPFAVNPGQLLAGDRPYIENFRWEPDRGTRFLVFDRSTGRLRATLEAEPFFTFHHVNAFEAGDAVIVDLCTYEDPSIIDDLYMERIDAGGAGLSAPRLWRYRLDLRTGRTTDEQLTSIPLELPRIDYARSNGRRYRYAYGISANDPGDWSNVLAKVDVADGSFALWHEPGCYPGEPIFVHAPDAPEQDAGVVLSVVLNPRTGRSFLLVLDARTLEEAARAELPQHVPLGFHGDFFSS